MFDKGQTTRQRGEAAEALALAHLQRHGLRLVERNYRLAQGPAAHGGEIDLILRERDGTLVFVEVRWRRGGSHGGAAALTALETPATSDVSAEVKPEFNPAVASTATEKISRDVDTRIEVNFFKIGNPCN